MRKLLILTAIILLAGCAQTGPAPALDLTLDQMLSGKTASEQRDILREMCLKEVQKTPFDRVVHHLYKNDPEVPMLSQICNKMAAAMQPCNIELK